MTIIYLGTGLFTILVMLIVFIILQARRLLIKGGSVKVVINNEKELLTQPGEKLLNILSSEKIFVSSACGGGGSCGQCKVKVLEGGGSLLPTEKAHINRKLEREGFRLSCQLPVKNDIKIFLPPEVFNAKEYECRVISNSNVATFIKELVLQLPVDKFDFEAGGYIQIRIPPYSVNFSDFVIEEQFKSDWERFGLFELRSVSDKEVIRAYSMANYPLEGNVVKLNVRIATPPPKTTNIPPGIGSSYIFSLKAGDVVKILGPFGEFKASETDAEMVFIGGGAGMAPLRSIIFDQIYRLKSGRKISYWYGARSLKEIFYADEFDKIQSENDNFKWHVALSEPLPEDNWTGLTGFIHEVVYREYLKNHPAPEDVEYYLCGPPMMLKAVLNLLDSLGVEKKNIRFDDFGS